jgi:threonine aldolase
MQVILIQFIFSYTNILEQAAEPFFAAIKTLIEKMPHMIKIHGGNMFGNWLNAAMASYKLDGIEERLQEAIKRSKEIFTSLNQIPGIKISP